MTLADAISETEPFIYPWENITPAQRFSTLRTKNKKKIVYICISHPADLYSSFRYRAFNMCQALSKSTDYIATYFFEEELKKLSGYLDQIHQIIIERIPWTMPLGEFIALAKAKNIQVHFDIDDYIYDIKAMPLVVNTISAIRPHDPTFDNLITYASKLFLTASLCDSYITTNARLANKLQDSFQKPVGIIPNFLNTQQMLISHQLWEIKRKKESQGGKFLIGYFSGTPSHNKDFNSIADDLFALMKANPAVHLRLVGYLELPHPLEELKNAGRIEFLPLQNYVSLQKYIAECDLNLIPLVMNEFTHCKSEIKYFEAAAVGTLSVASPTFIYTQVIQHGQNGFLSMQGKWKETIEYIINNFQHLSQLREATRDHALKNYYGNTILKKIEDLFDNFPL